MKTIDILGVDISMNHGAFVLLRNGSLLDFRFVTDKSVLAKKHKRHAMYLAAAKIKDMVERDFLRLAFWYSYSNQIFKELPSEYLGIEGYAYRASQNAHQIGGVASVFRVKAWIRGLKIRVHGPETVKMFSADDGNAAKSEVRYAMHEKYSETESFDEYTHGSGSAEFQIPEDLCDAYALAQLLWLEIRLRNGAVELKDLSPKTIQIFNRTTKRWPVNILGRDWIQREL